MSVRIARKYSLPELLCKYKSGVNYYIARFFGNILQRPNFALLSPLSRLEFARDRNLITAKNVLSFLGEFFARSHFPRAIKNQPVLKDGFARVIKFRFRAARCGVVCRWRLSNGGERPRCFRAHRACNFRFLPFVRASGRADRRWANEDWRSRRRSFYRRSSRGFG